MYCFPVPFPKPWVNNTISFLIKKTVIAGMTFNDSFSL